MRTQLVQQLDPLAFDRPAAVLALDAEHDVIAGRQLQAGAGRPAEPARAKEIAIDRMAVDLVRRPEIMLDEKRRQRFSEQANPARTTRKPSILDIGPKDVVQIVGRRPLQDPVAGREQNAAARIGQLRQLVQHAGPKIRYERAFVDAVNQFGLHGNPAKNANTGDTAKDAMHPRLVRLSCN